MTRRFAVVAVLTLAALRPALSQSLEALNVQIHGYATQGFLYTTQNNIFTTNSSSGSADWTDSVLNVSAQPQEKLRFTVQARYFLLGNYGNAVTIDYALGDYKVNDKLGFRFGKVKTPWGLFNEIQDVDPAYLWALLPESIYPIDSRSSYLSHYGGVVYGTLAPEARFGRFEYRAWAGEGSYNAGDGYFIDQAEAGFGMPNGIKGPIYGGALHWRTPIAGLMAGVSALKATTWNASYTADNGATTGTTALRANTQPNYFATYERGKLMLATEYERNWGDQLVQLPSAPDSSLRNDDRGWYAMASYQLTSKLTVGVYESQNSDHQAAPGTDRYSKEWVFSGRYDFTPYLYVKSEEHLIRGTGLAFDAAMNPELQPSSNLTALKLGLAF